MLRGQRSYLCVPVTSEQSLWSEGSRCKPCCPQSPTRSTDTHRLKVKAPKTHKSKVRSETQVWSGVFVVYLPSSDWEVGEDAVLLILMAGVCLQTLTTDRSERRVRGTGQRDGSERQTVPFLCCSPRASVCCKTKNTESVTVSGSLLAWAPVPSESNRADVKVQWTLNSHRQKKIHSEDTLWTTNSC